MTNGTYLLGVEGKVEPLRVLGLFEMVTVQLSRSNVCDCYRVKGTADNDSTGLMTRGFYNRFHQRSGVPSADKRFFLVAGEGIPLLPPATVIARNPYMRVGPVMQCETERWFLLQA